MAFERVPDLGDGFGRMRVRTVLTSSYSSYYRRMLPKLLAAIEFKCNNTAYRPVMDALELLARYADVPGRVRHFAGADQVPVAGVVPEGWLEAVVDGDGKIERVGRRYRRTRRAAASRRACPSTADDKGKGEYPLLSTLNI